MPLNIPNSFLFLLGLCSCYFFLIGDLTSEIRITGLTVLYMVLDNVNISEHRDGGIIQEKKNCKFGMGKKRL